MRTMAVSRSPFNNARQPLIGERTSSRAAQHPRSSRDKRRDCAQAQRRSQTDIAGPYLSKLPRCVKSAGDGASRPGKGRSAGIRKIAGGSSGPAFLPTSNALPCRNHYSTLRPFRRQSGTPPDSTRSLNPHYREKSFAAQRHLLNRSHDIRPIAVSSLRRPPEQSLYRVRRILKRLSSSRNMRLLPLESRASALRLRLGRRRFHR